MKIAVAYKAQSARTRTARERSTETLAPFAFSAASAALLRAPLGRTLSGNAVAESAREEKTALRGSGVQSTGGRRSAAGSPVVIAASPPRGSAGAARRNAVESDSASRGRVETKTLRSASADGGASTKIENGAFIRPFNEAVASAAPAPSPLQAGIERSGGTTRRLDRPAIPVQEERREPAEHQAISAGRQPEPHVRRENVPLLTSEASNERQTRRPGRQAAVRQRATDEGMGTDGSGRTQPGGTEARNIRAYAAPDALLPSSTGDALLKSARGETDTRTSSSTVASPRTNLDESHGTHLHRGATNASEQKSAAPSPDAAIAAATQRPSLTSAVEPVRETDRSTRAADSLAASRIGSAVVEGRAAVAPAKQSAEVAEERIVRDAERGLIEQLQIMRENGLGDGEVRLRLSPPELGEVRIKIQLEGKKVRASFVVESLAVKEAIDGRVEHLSGALAREGFDLGRLDVSIGDGRAAKAWNDDGETGFGPLHGAAPARQVPLRTAAAVAGGINLFA